MIKTQETNDSHEPLRFDRHGSTGVLTLNRPAARNALNGALLDALHLRLSTIARDSTLGVLVLRGAGGYFCAGGDLKERRGLPLTGEASLQNRSVREGKLLTHIADMPQLTVAAVEGGAVGAGLAILCACDSVIAVGRCHFAAPEILTGKIPAQIAPYVLRAAGWREGRNLLLTGRRIDRDEARRIGIVDGMVPEGVTLDQSVAEILERFADIDPRAMAHTKALLRKATMPDQAGYAEIAAEAYLALDQGRSSLD